MVGFTAFFPFKETPSRPSDAARIPAGAVPLSLYVM